MKTSTPQRNLGVGWDTAERIEFKTVPHDIGLIELADSTH